MATTSIADVAYTTGSRIGRHFALVSALPSALFVLFVYALIASGAWTSDPDLDAVWGSLADLSVGEAAVLVVIALAVGLLLHPLQFATTQLLEGYWGTSSIGRALAVARVRHHRARAYRLNERRLEAKRRLDVDRDPKVRLASSAATASATPSSRPWSTSSPTSARAIPTAAARAVTPTRLGNILRRYEAMAGARYGLDAIAVAPHLALVASPARIAYVRDTRQQLDLAVRLCSLSLTPRRSRSCSWSRTAPGCSWPPFPTRSPTCPIGVR